MIKISDFKKHRDWIKIWSGKWSLQFDSHQAFWWTKNKNYAGRNTFSRVIYFFSNGVTDCWALASDKDELGDRLKALAKKDPQYFSTIASGLKRNGKKVLSFTKAHQPEKFNLKEFSSFWQTYREYFIYHVSVKYIVDYLSVDQVRKYLPVLEDARLYAEPVTREAENYLERVTKHLAGTTKYTPEMILSTTWQELEAYLKGGALPSRSELGKRFKNSTLLVDETGHQIYTGDSVAVIRKIIPSVRNASTVTGQIAYRGKAKGTVRVILNPLIQKYQFREGDILVTGMTRPEFLPIMHKAAAFVTDAGGILSHTAITAREMKKPCVIGTRIATKVFKDGDMVEVDAQKGIVRKIR